MHDGCWARGLSDAEVTVHHAAGLSELRPLLVRGGRLPALGPDVVADRMLVESGWEHLVAGMEAGNGVIMALPHIGSWEWGGAWLALQGYPMTSVAEPLKPPACTTGSWPSARPWASPSCRSARMPGGVLLRTLRAGELVGLLCDRDIVGNGIEVEFFGERTTMPAGPGHAGAAHRGRPAAHRRLQRPGARAHGRDHAAGADRAHRGLRADVARVTQLIAADLEQLIRRAPEQWYLFQPNWPSDTATGSAG